MNLTREFYSIENIEQNLQLELEAMKLPTLDNFHEMRLLLYNRGS